MAWWDDVVKNVGSFFGVQQTPAKTSGGGGGGGGGGGASKPPLPVPKVGEIMGATGKPQQLAAPKPQQNNGGDFWSGLNNFAEISNEVSSGQHGPQGVQMHQEFTKEQQAKQYQADQDAAREQFG